MRRIIGFLAGFMLLVVACGDTDRQTDKPSPTPPFTASPTVILAAPAAQILKRAEFLKKVSLFAPLEEEQLQKFCSPFPFLSLYI